MTTYQGEPQLAALGDGTRRRIVALLAAQGPLPVVRIAEQLPVSRPAVSQHLRVLKDARLVRDRAEGTRRVYCLDDAGVADIRAYLAQFWRDDLTAYAAHVRATIEAER